MEVQWESTIRIIERQGKGGFTESNKTVCLKEKVVNHIKWYQIKRWNKMEGLPKEFKEETYPFLLLPFVSLLKVRWGRTECHQWAYGLNQASETPLRTFFSISIAKEEFFLLYSKLGRYKSKSSRDHHLERDCLRMKSMQRTMKVKKKRREFEY